jgi:hypothetical protein
LSPEGGKQVAWDDEDSELGLRIRMRRCEESNARLEAKVDRLQWTFVAAAIGYVISLWAGIGGGPGG